MSVQGERFLEYGFPPQLHSVGLLQHNGQPLSGGFDSGTVNATVQGGLSRTIPILSRGESMGKKPLLGANLASKSVRSIPRLKKVRSDSGSLRQHGVGGIRGNSVRINAAQQIFQFR